MMNLENFQSMVKNIDEFAKWLNENCGDDAAWILWYDKNYCKECSCVNINGEESCGWDADYAYCEIHKKCRFFPEKMKFQTVWKWLRCGQKVRRNNGI